MNRLSFRKGGRDFDDLELQNGLKSRMACKLKLLFSTSYYLARDWKISSDEVGNGIGTIGHGFSLFKVRDHRDFALTKLASPITLIFSIVYLFTWSPKR